MAIQVSSRGYKIDRFLHKNQHTQRKLLNSEFWINGKLSKLGIMLVIKNSKKMILSKNVNNKKCFFNEKKIEKDSDDF